VGDGIVDRYSVGYQGGLDRSHHYHTDLMNTQNSSLLIKLPLSALAVMAAVVSAGTASAAITYNSSSWFGTEGATAISTTGTYGYGYVNDGTALKALFGHPSLGTPLNKAYNDIRLLDSTGNAYTETATVITTTGGTYNGSTVIVSELATLQANAGTIYTFDGDAAYGGIGSWGTSDGNAFTVAFNDLGVGTFDITLYLGHSSDGRTWSTDYSLNGATAVTVGAGGTAASLNGGSGGALAYTINVTTTDAADDVSLTFSTTGGGSGTGYFAGYTVAIPEPSVALLGGLGALMLLRRRRI
jgi:hypothetical protein